MSRKTKRRSKLKGLVFNYRYGYEVFRDKYLTLEDFFEQSLKKENELAVKPTSEILNVMWNGDSVCFTEDVKTLQQLYDYLLTNEIFTTPFIYQSVKKVKRYERIGRRYSPEEVLPFRESITGKRNKKYGKESVHMDSLRYSVFNESLVCSDCGRVGVYFVKERDLNRSKNVNPVYHFNLYANDNGKETLMCKSIETRDETGKPDLYVTRCEDCTYQRQQERSIQRAKEIEILKLTQEKGE